MNNTLPQMGERKRRYIEDFLTTFSQEKQPVRVLEWGSGGSTVYFTRWLHGRNISFEWVSLEYDPQWYEKVMQELGNDPDVSLVLFDTNGQNPRRRDVQMDDYVNYPRTLNQKFDLIIVDGRKRRRCVLEARELLSDRGTVLLDDAFRPRYWCAMQAYPQGRFLFDSFWVGGISNPEPVQSAVNFLNRFFHFIFFRLKWLVRSIKQRLVRLSPKA